MMVDAGPYVAVAIKKCIELMSVILRVCVSLRVCVCALRPHLGSLISQVHPLGGGEVHRLGHAVAAAHSGHKRSREAHHKLTALLDRPVDPDALPGQHLRRDLEIPQSRPLTTNTHTLGTP